MAALAASALASALAGCASIVEGRSEQIKVATKPGGADCALERRGQVIGRIPGTPGFTTIRQTGYSITIRCKKSGYRDATYRIYSDTTGVIFGNIGHGGTDPANTPSWADRDHDSEYDIVLYLALVPFGTPTHTVSPRTN